MSTANQQTLVESGALDRPPILKKRSYVTWASHFLRFLDNKRGKGELMKHSIDKGPYKRKEILDPNDDIKTIIEPLSEMSQQNKNQYYADIKDQKLNARNQAVIKDGHVDIQSKNAGYARNGNRNARRTNGNQATNAHNGLVQSIDEYEQNVQRVPRTNSTSGKINVQCYNYKGKGYYARECPKPRVRDAKYFREQMLLATKDEVRVHLDVEENNFMLDNAYKDNTLEELNTTVIMMAHIQPTNDKSDAKPTYDAEFISEVNDSQIDMITGLLSKSDHEQRHHEKLETIIHTLAVCISNNLPLKEVTPIYKNLNIAYYALTLVLSS
ncbi:integrase, catalytic region, zinc finger, CCHC-type containing protein [Tanacetum coccineum]